MHQRQERTKSQEKIQRILEDSKGIKNIPGIKSAKKRILITKIQNEKRRSQKSNKNETENNKEDQGADVKERKEIPEFTIEELQAAINRLKKGKTGDSNGIKAEDNKTCDEETKEMVRQGMATNKNKSDSQ